MPLESTQGHTLRARTASADRRFVMAHTLVDVVLRACDDDEAAARAAAAAQLADVNAELEREGRALREAVAAELARLKLKLRAGLGNATARAHAAGAELPLEPTIAGRARGSRLGGLLGEATRWASS